MGKSIRGSCQVRWYIYIFHLLWVLQFELGETLKGLPLQERLENIEVHVFSLFFCLPCVLLVLLDVARGRHCSKCWRSFLKWAPAESTESQHDARHRCIKGAGRPRHAHHRRLAIVVEWVGRSALHFRALKDMRCSILHSREP